ncbi:ATP-binding protein [Oligoflexus tunisiensis]|uniref:ATP-binding protein n=1 Tax=Oligoflexus tunisiensis TaxID=708132 RepID=UPI00114D2A1B|nr:ATP-binding protein [Oligoflexus tunisiensis]
MNKVRIILLTWVWAVFSQPCAWGSKVPERKDLQHIRTSLFDDPCKTGERASNLMHALHPERQTQAWLGAAALAAEGHWLCEQPEKAADLARKALPIAFAAQDHRAITILHSVIAGAEEYADHYEEAKAGFLKTLEEARKANDPSLLAYYYSVTGNFFDRNGEERFAFEAYQNALAAFQSLPKDERYYDFIANMGTLYTSLGGEKMEAGRAMLEEALDWFTRNKKRYATYYILDAIAYHHYEQKRLDESSAVQKKAQAVAQSLGYQHLVAHSDLRLGRNLIEDQKPREALVFLQKALPVFRRLSFDYQIGPTLLAMARAWLLDGQTQPAWEACQELEQYFGPQGSLHMRVTFQKVKADVLQAMGRSQEELLTRRQLGELSDKYWRERNAVTIARMATSLELQRQEHQNVLLQEQNRIQTLELQQSQRLHRTVYISLVGLLILAAAAGWALMKTRDARNQKLRMQSLIEQEQARTTFFHNTSHELRTPLTGIIGFIDLIRSGHYGTVNETIQGQLDKAKRLAESLKNQVNMILDLAKSKRGELSLAPVRIDLHRLQHDIDDLAEGLLLRYPHSQYDSRLDLKSGEANFVQDREKIYTIARNLIGNAFKFAKPGRTNQVTLRLERLAGELILSVSDTGIGIAPDQRQRIFEEFAQVESDARRKYEGTGLGLSLVKQLIDLMHGRIELDSTPDKGSRFRVWIPESAEQLLTVTEQEKPLMETSRLERIPTNSVPLPAHVRMASPLLADPGTFHILVIDDHESNCEILAEILKSEGYRTSIAIGGKAGMDAIVHLHPDLVILDLMMPDISGEDVLRFVQGREDLCDTPVILVTARASEDDRLIGLEWGADDYLAKPINPLELTLRVRNLVGRIQLQRYQNDQEQRDRMVQLGEIFTDLSHEIKSILTSSRATEQLTDQELRAILRHNPLDTTFRESLLDSLLERRPTYDFEKRAQALVLPGPEQPIPDSLRQLRFLLARTSIPIVELQDQWKRLQNWSPADMASFTHTLDLIFSFQELLRVTVEAQRLMRTILAFHQSPLLQTEIYADEAVAGTLLLLQRRLDKMRIRVFTDVPHIKIAIGLATLQQVFLNLLQNAMDVIESHVAEDRWIEVFGIMDYETKMLRIGVSNAGPKIDPLLARQIFERGFSTKGRRGSGLGLPVSRRLIKRFHGDLELDETAETTTFVLTLPLAVPGSGTLRPGNQAS